jgi:hypothetical protein
MSFASLIIAFVLDAPPDPPAATPSRDGELFYRWIKQTGQAVRQTEFGQMLAAVLSGSMMGPGDGWFRSAQGRYSWNWLAERYDADGDDRITREEFPGPKELFDRLDRDRNGELTESDFDWSDSSPYLRQLGQATQWLLKMDEDDDRRLSKEEWDHIFKKFAQGKPYLNADDVRAMFNPSPPPSPPGKSASKPNPMADMPSRPTLVKGLFSGELGSPFEGPKLNDQAPDFTLFDLDGKLVSLSQYRDKKPVVLIFGSFT